jgi:hypothetical protein
VPGLATEHARPSGTVARPPLRPQNAESQGSTGRRPGTVLARFLDPAATYNTVLTTPDRPLTALALGRAPLAEWSSRRYTRSPGEAGGGRSDLCHDNDEPDPVNRRGRIGDNPVDPTTELFASARGLREFIASWLASRDEELSTDLQEWKPEFGDNGEWSKCSGSCHIKGLAGKSSAVVLEPRMYHLQVDQVELAGRCRHPIQPTALCINQGEHRRPMRNGQREAGQSRARTQVGPMLPWLRLSNLCQAEGVVQVALPEPLLLPWTQKPEPDGLGIRLFEDFSFSRGEGQAPLRRAATRAMFHVKRYVGRRTTRR